MTKESVPHQNRLQLLMDFTNQVPADGLRLLFIKINGCWLVNVAISNINIGYWMKRVHNAGPPLFYCSYADIRTKGEDIATISFPSPNLLFISVCASLLPEQ